MAFTPTYYPVPTVNDTQDLLTLFQWISNTATDGLFFPIMIFVIWIVQFIGVLAEGKPASRAWVLASFTATILSIILGILAMVAQKWIYLLILMVSLGAFWVKLASARE
ncbi:hypothetical protein LCGC14_0652000 [marine sediment metagenome]|uniref:Uncharacterized protein n=1 Tax=marine sediment metagenome TaxID=412755 RepID=A0A0F9RFU5_9ZZZZ